MCSQIPDASKRPEGSSQVNCASEETVRLSRIVSKARETKSSSGRGGGDYDLSLFLNTDHLFCEFRYANELSAIYFCYLLYK